MRCPNCHAEQKDKNQFCRQCGTDLAINSRSLVPTQTNLPSVLHNAPVRRSVAAGVGALALGVGIELLRRNMLSYLRSPRPHKGALPDVIGVKDVLFPPQEKSAKIPKGYEVHETVVYMRRVIRRTR